MNKKKPLSPEQLAECEAAHSIFLKKKKELGLSQKKVADKAGIS
jgi:predicted transcriptional regulator